VGNGLFDPRIKVCKISCHFRQLFSDGLALQALYDSTGNPSVICFDSPWRCKKVYLSNCQLLPSCTRFTPLIG